MWAESFVTELLTACPAKTKTITFGSGFARLTRHLCHHGTLDSTAFWRGGLMPVACVFVCLLLQALRMFGLNWQVRFNLSLSMEFRNVASGATCRFTRCTIA